MQSIFLIGPRGSGKSSLSGLLGARLALPVRDTDQLLTAAAGASVAQLVAAGGWPAFRQLERDILAEAAALGGVIATGGGIVLLPENRELMRTSGRVFYLRASLETLRARLCNNPDPEARPALTALDPETELAAVLSERDPLYRAAAHHIIDADQPLRQVAEAVCRHVNLFSRRTP